VGSFVGVFLSWFEEKGKRKAGEGNLLLPLPRASRGRRRPIVPFKTAPFGSLFFFFETTPFYPKRTVSFKRNGAKNMSASNSVLNL
jgi:hypothetical protein